MRLTLTGLFKARWTDSIHEEWINAYIRKHPGTDREKLKRIRDLMNAHAGDALVEDYQSLEASIQLPDPNDRHVVAAAIKSGADAIVTFNVKHFPKDVLDRYHLEVLHPDDFIVYQVDLSAPSVCQAIKKMRAALKSPPFTAEELLLAFERNQLPVSAAALAEYIDSI